MSDILGSSRKNVLKSGVNVVLDGQWGSTGKGKLCGWLGMHGKPDVVMSSFGPNAGHTTVTDDGKVVLKCLPSSAITSDNARILIAPDSVFNVDRLMEEVSMLGCQDRILVHPNAAVITDEDRINAERTGRHLAGTMQGTGHAISRKMLRIEGTKLAKDVLPKSMVGDTSAVIIDYVGRRGTVLFEMSQGFDLSLNHGYLYPYLTSRDITIGAAINSMGVPNYFITNIIGSVRTYPIRVGNVNNGWSGPHYPDQTELTWKHITKESGSKEYIEEKTTVTKRVRRVFSFSGMQLNRFVQMNGPDELFLNFVQYLNINDQGKRSWCELSTTTKDFVEMIENAYQVRFGLIGTGAHNDDIIVR